MADPLSLVVADAAAQAVEFVGLPEAQLNLAQAVVHLATAPKSNRVRARHLAGPRATCASGVGGEVPVHLRDAHYRAAAVARPRRGLRLSSRRPTGLGRPAVPARPRLADAVYYEPSGHGYEQEIAERMQRLADGPHHDEPRGDQA